MLKKGALFNLFFWFFFLTRSIHGVFFKEFTRKIICLLP